MNPIADPFIAASASGRYTYESVNPSNTGTSSRASRPAARGGRRPAKAGVRFPGRSEPRPDAVRPARQDRSAIMRVRPSSGSLSTREEGKTVAEGRAISCAPAHFSIFSGEALRVTRTMPSPRPARVEVHARRWRRPADHAVNFPIAIRPGKPRRRSPRQHIVLKPANPTRRSLGAGRHRHESVARGGT